MKFNFGEGELVDADSVVALIGEAGEEVAADEAVHSRPPRRAGEPAVVTPAPPAENGQSAKASPVARRVAADKGVDLDAIPGPAPADALPKRMC